MAIEEGDQLLSARLVRAEDEVLLGTASGMSIRFKIEDVRPMGRDTRGVRGIDLRGGDRVIGMDIVENEAEQQVLAISANGYGKRTPVRSGACRTAAARASSRWSPASGTARW